jgi:hypothetical protein
MRRERTWLLRLAILSGRKAPASWDALSARVALEAPTFKKYFAGFGLVK